MRLREGSIIEFRSSMQSRSGSDSGGLALGSELMPGVQGRRGVALSGAESARGRARAPKSERERADHRAPGTGPRRAPALRCDLVWQSTGSQRCMTCYSCMYVLFHI